MKKTLTLVHLFLLNQVVMILTVLLIIGVYGAHMFFSEQGAIRERMEPALTREAERLSSDIFVLESNIQRLKSLVELFDVMPKAARLEKFRTVAAATIAPHSSEFNAYFALNPRLSKKYFGKKAYMYVVMRDYSLRGTSKFHDANYLIAEEFKTAGYTADPDAQWWAMNEKSPGINFSEFYFDKGYMEQVMFSSTLGIYSKGKLQAVVGIDTLASDIASRMGSFQFGETGGAIIVDNYGRPVLPLISKDLPIIGYEYRKARSTDEFKRMPKISEKEFNLQGQKLSDFKGTDGKSYLTYSKPLKGRPWHLVIYQTKSEAYSGLYLRMIFFGLVTLAGYALLTLMVYLTGRYVMSQDKKVLAELMESRDRAEAATKAKSLFLSTMSHEIRTPLNAMLGSSELLGETSLNTDQKELLGSLQSSGETLLSMLNNILDVSKFESGKLQLENREFLLSDLVREVEAVVSNSMARKGLKFVFQGPNHDRWMFGDSLRLKQVLLNLLGNAMKFTDHGGVELSIKPYPAREPGKEYFQFEVRDTGVGIAKENLQKIFDEFGQEDSSVTRRFGGTGLGLSISQKLVRVMGGELHCESEQFMGSKFFFSLEIKSRKGDVWNVNFENHPVLVATPPRLQLKGGAYRRILIVDDMEENHALLRAYLKKVSQLQIDSALNGYKCLEMWEQNHYDVIFMDVQMPSISGLDTIRRLREHERIHKLPRTPVVVISANSFLEDIEKSILAGADEHCGKPIRKQTVLGLVEKYGFSPAPAGSEKGPVNS